MYRYRLSILRLFFGNVYIYPLLPNSFKKILSNRYKYRNKILYVPADCRIEEVLFPTDVVLLSVRLLSVILRNGLCLL